MAASSLSFSIYSLIPQLISLLSGGWGAWEMHSKHQAKTNVTILLCPIRQRKKNNKLKQFCLHFEAVHLEQFTSPSGNINSCHDVIKICHLPAVHSAHTTLCLSLAEEDSCRLLSARMYQLTDQSGALSLWEVGCIQHALRHAVNTVTFKKQKICGM